MKSSPLIVANIAALAATLFANYLANALPIGGRRTGEVSDLFPNLFAPAGFTFAIWGVIYLLLIGFAVFQARFWGKPRPAFLENIGWLFVLSCLANAGWLMAFHHLQIGLSMLLMLVLLGCLASIYLRLDTKKSNVSMSERWFVRLPFSVYLGWVTVATIANTTILFVHWGWSGAPGGPQCWTVLTLAAAVGIAWAALWQRRDAAFALVIAWALFGIFSKRTADLSTPDGWVETAAAAGLAIVGIGLIWRTIGRFRAA